MILPLTSITTLRLRVYLINEPILELCWSLEIQPPTCSYYLQKIPEMSAQSPELTGGPGGAGERRLSLPKAVLQIPC